MITGIDPNLAKDYISKFDSGEPKTVWKIGALTAHAFAYVGSKIADQAKSIEGMIEVVRFGLKGFDNFKTSAGVAIAYETQRKQVGSHDYDILKDAIIESMPVDLIIELGSEILKASKLTEQEIKN